ncbi:hypothetical protein KEJ15_05325 [Candidatus Bathyarchaeota archaeon]|nr:hypothetical protein [Candidatus Bathyarchaeota archaeon]
MSLKRLITSAFVYAFFITVSLILLIICHVIWFLTAKQIGYALVASLDLDLNIATVLQDVKLYLIATFFTIFCLSFVRFKWQEKKSLNTFLLLSIAYFLVFLAFGVLILSSIPLMWHWSNLTYLILMGGVIAVSNHLSAYVSKFKKMVNDELKWVVDAAVYSKKLELDHVYHQNLLQWLTWAIVIFLTGAIVAGFTSPVEIPPHPTELRVVELQNTILLVLWSVIWAWFGLLGPLSAYMRFLRDCIGKLSVDKIKNS